MRTVYLVKEFYQSSDGKERHYDVTPCSEYKEAFLLFKRIVADLVNEEKYEPISGDKYSSLLISEDEGVAEVEMTMSEIKNDKEKTLVVLDDLCDETIVAEVDPEEKIDTLEERIQNYVAEHPGKMPSDVLDAFCLKEVETLFVSVK